MTCTVNIPFIKYRYTHPIYSNSLFMLITNYPRGCWKHFSVTLKTNDRPQHPKNCSQKSILYLKTNK